MMLSHADWSALWLSFKLGAISTTLLLLIAIPLGMWLAFTRFRYKAIVSSILTLPLILPPTVIGFYLLLLLGPSGLIGRLCNLFGIKQLTFTFSGLVIASIIYSLPFVLLPIQNAFSAIGKSSLEAAATLGAKPLNAVLYILLPQAKVEMISAGMIGFAHTIGEFGMVLMIGGNIPQKTQVASIQIYNHFETYEYSQANHLALVLLGFSFIVLLALYKLKGQSYRQE